MTLIFLFFFVFCPFSSSNAGEGFYSIESLKKRYPKNVMAFVPTDTGGMTRIHATEPYFLTALHVVFNPDELGKEWTPSKIGKDVVYRPTSHLKGKIIRVLDLVTQASRSFEVAAHGHCFGGFPIDIYAHMPESLIREGKDCLTGDWVILKELSEQEEISACLKPARKSEDHLMALGASRQTVKRQVRPEDFVAHYEENIDSWIYQLDGKIYSIGRLLSFEQLATDAKSHFRNIWQKLAIIYQNSANNFILTDSEAVRGMSGGPIVNTSDFSLTGVTTVSMIPANKEEYPQEKCLDCFYRWGRHMGVSILTIEDQLGAEFSTYFQCK